MIVSLENLKKQVDTNEVDETVETRLTAIEGVIRAYTNNNFQNRFVRFAASSTGQTINGSADYLREGDTIQVSESGVNDGLYIITAVEKEKITVDRKLFSIAYNLVTKVQYPPDVVQCAVDLYRWSQTYGEKIGVKSETLSRHSVSYEDSATLYMGYPVGILSGLKLYRKARC